jgi:hypothetical protein
MHSTGSCHATTATPKLAYGSLFWFAIDPCGWLRGYAYIIWPRNHFLNNQCSMMQLCILKWIPCLESPLLIDYSHPDSPVQSLNSQHSPKQNANLKCSCLHKSLLNSTLLSPHGVAVTLRKRTNTLFWAQWRRITAASGTCRWGNSCILTDDTFLKWPISVHCCHTFRHKMTIPECWDHAFPNQHDISFVFWGFSTF